LGWLNRYGHWHPLYDEKRQGTWKDIGKSDDELYDKTREEIAQSQRKMEELVNREKDSYEGGKKP
jgi:hypothetical protein